MNNKLISIILCGFMCAAALAGCAREEKKEPTQPATYGVEGRLPSENVNYDELIPSYEFVGTYSSKDYTAEVTQESDEIMNIRITSAKKDKVSCEWTIQGYFDEQTYYVNYTNAVKVKTSYNTKGAVLSSKTEYENGSGVVMFSGDGKLVWRNMRETIDGDIQLIKNQNGDKGDER